MKKGFTVWLAFFLAMFFVIRWGEAQTQIKISEATEACLTCHSALHPGIVAEWKKSRHASIVPAEAIKKVKLERRVSAQKVPDSFTQSVVGCAECHMMNSEKHQDSFDHNGFKVHIVVTPTDCSTCHPIEVQQYGKNLMSHAYGNLMNNPVYRNLADEVNGIHLLDKKKTTFKSPDHDTHLDT